ncbi:MAG: hypothetical protein WKF84_14795 [Pyrinomonadaceae bacterium]
MIRRRAPVRASQQSRPAQSRPTAAVTNNTTAPTNIPTTTITNSKVPVAKSDPEVVATTTVPRVNENKELVASMPTIADQVEEALEQGNAARDASPPRYAEAERAYKKAAVLDSKDARVLPDSVMSTTISVSSLTRKSTSAAPQSSMARTRMLTATWPSHISRTESFKMPSGLRVVRLI